MGRCIRHKFDYGAIVLLDERFRQPRNQAGLSRWVRGTVRVNPDFAQGMASLRAFFERLEQDPRRGLEADRVCEQLPPLGPPQLCARQAAGGTGQSDG